jgi:hypothetical protein
MPLGYMLARPTVLGAVRLPVGLVVAGPLNGIQPSDDRSPDGWRVVVEKRAGRSFQSQFLSQFSIIVS